MSVYVNKLKLEKKIKFLKFQSNTDKYFAESDLFINTSFFEGFPNSVVEAISYNVPVLCSKSHGGFHDFIKNDTYGNLFDINNSFGQTDISNTHSLGQVLYTDYIHIFQISGMILLVAMVGAIVLTFRQRTGVKRQSYIKQISRERNESIELKEVESKKGVKIDV